MFSMSHDTTIITTIDRNNNNITNFHSVLKMIDDCRELMFKLLLVHIRGFAFGILQENFKSHFGYDLD
jgi:hypothetical protein